MPNFGWTGFGDAKNEDFTYSYAGYDTKGEVTISYKGKKVDPKLISPLTRRFGKRFMEDCNHPRP